IDNLVFPFAGVFKGEPANGLRETVLVKSSSNSELVDSMIATAESSRILRGFKPSNTEYPIAIHLSGWFRTAFQEGSVRAIASAGGETNSMKSSASAAHPSSH